MMEHNDCCKCCTCGNYSPLIKRTKKLYQWLIYRKTFKLYCATSGFYASQEDVEQNYDGVIIIKRLDYTMVEVNVFNI